MKYYVTLTRKQNVTYLIEADSKKEAVELATYKASVEDVPYDISDAEYKNLDCISHMDYLLYMREEKNN